jgi:hypothetical protein
MAKKTKINAKQVVSELKDCERWLITVSKLNPENEKIETIVTSNNFLTNDFPLIRKHLSEQLFELWATKEALEDGMTKKASAIESKIQGMIE